MADREFFYFLGQLPFAGSIEDGFLTQDKSGLGADYGADIRVVDHENTLVVDYDLTDGAAFSNTNSAATKATVGFDADCFHRLLADFPSGIHVCKLTLDGPLGGSTPGDRWSSSFSESYSAFTAADDLLVADLSGDTKVPKGIALCLGYKDAYDEDADAVAEIADELGILVTSLRSRLGNIPVVLDMPPSSISGWATAANDLLPKVRAQLRTAAATIPNVSIVYTDDLQRVASTDGLYTGAAMLELGRRLYTRMSEMLAGSVTAPAVSQSAVPTYVMLGDEAVLGVVDNSFLEEDSVEATDGSGNIQIWNIATQAWEPYDGELNSNTAGELSSNFGPDVALVHQLARRHSNEQVRIFKFGKTQTGLTVEGANGSWHPSEETGPLVDAVAEWRKAVQSLAADGLVPDVLGVTLSLGRGDSEAGSADYRVALGLLVSSVRRQFGSRSGDLMLEVPVAVVQDLSGDGVRAGQQTLARWDPNVALVDVDRFPRHSDGVNLSGSGLLDAGVAIAVALGTLGT